MEQNTAPAPKKSNTAVIVAVIAVIALAIIGALVTQNNKTTKTTATQTTESNDSMQKTDETPAMTPAPTTDANADDSNSMMTDEKVVNVEAGSFYFKPNEIRVKKGQKVKIIMKSVSMMHDFNIDALNVKMPIVKNGDTGEVEFTADQTGSFEYYCSVGQHRQMGQVGTLIVE